MNLTDIILRICETLYVYAVPLKNEVQIQY